MKKLVLILTSTALLLLTSCDNTLEVTAPWKDIPVVHAILSPLDTAHYVRIEKAYLDPNKSALEIAQIADSIYYPDLDAVIREIATGIPFRLVAVDAAAEGYPRDTGIFAAVPNILYKIEDEDFKLVPSENYRIEINRSERLPLVTAETQVVNRPTIMRPLPGQAVRFLYAQPFKFVWQESENAFFYDVKMVINYAETPPGDPTMYIDKQLPWKIGQFISANEYAIEGINFYEYLAAELEENPLILRRFNGIDVIVEAGGQELYEYRTILQANSGITGIGGDIPVYSNLSEGFGIFTSSNGDVNLDYELHPESLDSLRNGYITRDLNFQ